MKILIDSLEDDLAIQKIINRTLLNQNFDIKFFIKGEDFIKSLKERKPNVLLLDLMLPDADGEKIIEYLRARKEYDDVSIIVVSAKNLSINKVECLDLGADDYLEKPFDILELISRINVQLRKKKDLDENIISYKDLNLNKSNMVASFKDINVSFTRSEFVILEKLIEADGMIVKRNELTKEVNVKDSRAVDMHIKSIRKKLGSSLISTIYGVGYKLN